jgi:ssDNA-binding replication factor A large subunit
MVPQTSAFAKLRPGMEHLTFRVKLIKIVGVRKVKTYTGVEHSILEGVISDGSSSLGFVVWNEKIDLFTGVTAGDDVELTDCFITSFKGVLQINVGRDSNIKKMEA